MNGRNLLLIGGAATAYFLFVKGSKLSDTAYKMDILFDGAKWKRTTLTKVNLDVTFRFINHSPNPITIDYPSARCYVNGQASPIGVTYPKPEKVTLPAKGTEVITMSAEISSLSVLATLLKGDGIKGTVEVFTAAAGINYTEKYPINLV